MANSWLRSSRVPALTLRRPQKDVTTMPLRVLVALALLALTSCRLDNCGVYLHNPSSYSGQSTATAPYLERVEFYTREVSCTKNLSCVATTVVVLAVHNPSATKTRAAIRCQYVVAGADQAKVRPSPVVVPARHSRVIEIGTQLGVSSDLTPLAVDCTATYK